VLDQIRRSRGSLRRVARLDGLACEVKEFPSLDGGIPDSQPHDTLTLRRVHDRVTIAVPSRRAAHRLVLIVQMLEQEQARLELSEIVFVDLGCVAESTERDPGRKVLVNEERRRVDYLFGGNRHVAIDAGAGLPFLEVPVELGAAQIREN